MLISKLNKARIIKNNEYYTRMVDVRDMVERYAPHLAGKRIYCNADDYRYSNFYKYLSENYDDLQLRGLTATAYSGSLPGLFASGGVKARYIDATTVTEPLGGDGDYRSPECLRLLDEHDIVITNPPFSGWAEYLQTLIDSKIHFLIVGALTPLGNPYPFSQYMAGNVWLADGSPSRGSVMYFDAPDGSPRRVPACWYTNIAGRMARSLYEPLTSVYNAGAYPCFDNYPDVINVDSVRDIPVDYTGKMGVPLTYLAQHDPAVFDVVGMLGNDRYLHGKKTFKRVVIQRRRRGGGHNRYAS